VTLTSARNTLSSVRLFTADNLAPSAHQTQPQIHTSITVLSCKLHNALLSCDLHKALVSHDLHNCQLSVGIYNADKTHPMHQHCKQNTHTNVILQERAHPVLSNQVSQILCHRVYFKYIFQLAIFQILHFAAQIQHQHQCSC